jgi:hypothetical protein
MARTQEHLTAPDRETLENRIELLEAHFENQSAYVEDVILEAITIQGNQVPGAECVGQAFGAINSIKACLVDHGLMAAQ